jgi:hypothetical protein
MKLFMKLVGLLGLQLDPMLVSVKTLTTPTRPMEITSSYNASYSVPKRERRKPLIRYVDPQFNLVLYVTPDTDIDVVVKLIEWTMGIDWARTLDQ